MSGDGESIARNPAPAQSTDAPTNIVFLMDDEGHVQTRLQGPVGTQASLTAVSPDAARVAVIWLGPKESVFTLHEPDSGKRQRRRPPRHRFNLGAGLQPGRHAHRHRRRGWADTPVGHVHRQG